MMLLYCITPKLVFIYILPPVHCHWIWEWNHGYCNLFGWIMDDIIQPLTCCTAHNCALTFTGLCRTCVSKAKVNIKLRALVISCVWPICPWACGGWEPITLDTGLVQHLGYNSLSVSGFLSIHLLNIPKRKN